MFDWDTLRFVLAVSREGTILGAARELGVNVATVSRQIGRAEEALQAKLFDRRHKGLSPTAHGQLAIKVAASIYGDIERLHRQVEGTNQDEAGTIRFSLPLNVMPYGFSGDIRKFKSKHPGVTFEVNATDDQVDFSELEADVVLRVGENPPASLWGYKIATVAVSFFGSQAFMEEWGDRIEKEPDTAPVPFIELSTARPAADREEFLARFPMGQSYASCNGMDSLIPLVRDGVGAGRMMNYMARQYPDLVKIFGCSEQWSRSVWILTHRDYRNTRRIRLFMDFIRDRFEERERNF